MNRYVISQHLLQEPRRIDDIPGQTFMLDMEPEPEPIQAELFCQDSDSVLKHPMVSRENLANQGATFHGSIGHLVAHLPDGRVYVPAHDQIFNPDMWVRWK